MSRSKHDRASSSTEALRRFKALLPKLLSDVEQYGTARLKITREFRRSDGQPSVAVIREDPKYKEPR